MNQRHETETLTKTPKERHMWQTNLLHTRRQATDLTVHRHDERYEHTKVDDRVISTGVTTYSAVITSSDTGICKGY